MKISFATSRVSGQGPRPHLAAFTMMEIAICLAIIGFALVAIIGVLPYGMHTQRNNHDETIINQDATMLIEAIHSGARSQFTGDLTNYVYAITNDWVRYDADTTNIIASGINYYTHNAGFAYEVSAPQLALTNDAIIIGLLSTPEFTDGVSFDTVSNAIPSTIFGGYKNHVVAYVHSMSGLAVEKPPQNNQIMLDDTFSYQVVCVNAPLPAATNVFREYQPWSASATYNRNARVIHDWTYWEALQDNLKGNIPGEPESVNSVVWAKVPNYELEQLANLRELRLKFLWPLRPNGTLGDGGQNFRVTVAGQLNLNTNQSSLNSISSGPRLFYYQPQSFIATP